MQTLYYKKKQTLSFVRMDFCAVKKDMLVLGIIDVVQRGHA